MSSESGDRKPVKPHHLGAPPPEPEHLPCPRCDSVNTKFCYYNNYNFSQPRYFCKACRRYWTHGGALRDIPVGGGSRKTAKRLRTAVANNQGQYRMPVLPTATPVFLPLGSSSADNGGSVHLGGGGEGKPGLNVCGSFTSLLSTQAPGFMALGGYGLGLSTGFDDMGFGFGRAVWPFPGVGDGGAGGGVCGGGGSVMGNTWQLESGEGGFVNGECFSWPDLAISTPGSGLSQMKI